MNRRNFFGKIAVGALLAVGLKFHKPQPVEHITQLWSEVDKELYHRLPMYFAEYNFEKANSRDGFSIWSRILGKQTFPVDAGNCMRALK